MQRYNVTCLASLYEPMLRPFLADIGIEPISHRIEHGYAIVTIECDAEKAYAIGQRFFITDQEGNEPC